MIRIDIYAHEALEKPLKEALAPIPSSGSDAEGRNGRPFTLLKQVAGRGAAGSSFGDDVWPESNLLLILYVAEDEETQIRESLDGIRQAYPRLGLAAYKASGYSGL